MSIPRSWEKNDRVPMALHWIHTHTSIYTHITYKLFSRCFNGNSCAYIKPIRIQLYTGRISLFLKGTISRDSFNSAQVAYRCSKLGNGSLGSEWCVSFNVTGNPGPDLTALSTIRPTLVTSVPYAVYKILPDLQSRIKSQTSTKRKIQLIVIPEMLKFYV